MLPVAVSERLVTLVQALMAPSLAPAGAAAAAGGAGAGVGAVALPDNQRAHAYLCLGKLCLRDATLAKRFVPVLVRDLRPAQCHAPAVRNNVLFVLGDLCLRYTALVDRHAAAMAEALADPAALVRRHAVALLAQLVTTDYLKWRAHTFYRFAAAVADDDEGVRAAALAAITGPLLTKNRLLLQAHFVDLVFVLAGCTSHPAYLHLVQGGVGTGAGAGSAAAQDAARAGSDVEDGSDSFPSSFAAAAAEDSCSDELLRRLVMSDAQRRMRVFRALLAAMPEEQRFTVHGKLAVEVLGGLLEGTLKLTPPARLAQLMQKGAAAAGGARKGGSTPNGAHHAGMLRALTPLSVVRGDDGDGDFGYGDNAGAGGSGAASESSGGLWFPEGSTEALVAEVFAILSCADMRVGAPVAGARGAMPKAAADADDDGEDDAEVAGGAGVIVVASLAQAKSRLMAKLARKQAVENVLPICIGLKQLFAQHRSPLRAPLMGYLVGLFADFGEDVREVLSADRQTAAEFEFDLRQFTEQQEAVASAAASSRRQSFLARSIAASTPFSVPPSPAPKLMSAEAPLPSFPLSPAPSIRALTTKPRDRGRRKVAGDDGSVVVHVDVALEEDLEAAVAGAGKRSRRARNAQ
jgi:hypothetical protein